MVKFLTAIVFALILYGCATPSETYKSIVALKKGSIGFAALQQDTLSDSTFASIDNIYRETVPKAFKINNFKPVLYIAEKVEFKDSSVRQNQIKEICQTKNLDAIIITNMRVFEVLVDYRIGLTSSPFGGSGVRVDFKDRKTLGLEVEMKLFDKNGNQLMVSPYTSEDSKFNGEMSQEQIFESAIRIATNTIIDKIKQRRY